ncbi:MAG: FAD-binding oxidoreductase, partial [Candidatus Zixiibacteriota bacterium]
PDQLRVASIDESTLSPVTPLAVVWATSTKEISDVVKLCAEHKVPITSRGGGSALEGSAIPVKNGIVLDLSRMTRILEYWPEDLQVKVEPGIIYDDLNKQLQKDGLFFPPSPGGSGNLATIGGMVATNASGIYAVKYGGTRDYVLQLEIVTGIGEVIKLGSRAVKRSSGYELLHLIVGSEGTLGIVTSITLKLAGIPEGRLQIAYKFKDEISAARAVSEMKRSGVDLAAVEFLDRRVVLALNKLKDYGLEETPCLFVEFHGPKATIESNLEMAGEICRDEGGQELKLSSAQSPWEIRHYVTESIKHLNPGYTIIRNDVAFPISKLPEMVNYCYDLGDQNDILIHTFGHVGMGFLHALMLARKEISKEWDKALAINDRIIKKALEFGGTISGEHGIGLGHKELMKVEHGRSLELMKLIKREFDPHGILNPGKIFDL